MGTTAHLAIRNAVAALLTAPPALAGGFVQAGRAFPLPTDKTQGIYVRLQASPGQQPFVGDGRTDWSTTLLITCVARGDAGVDGETAVDGLLYDTYARLAAAAPPANADGLVVVPGLDWDVDEADTTLGAATFRIQVQHRTASGSLDTAA